jgi:hypothetical protein
MRVHACGRARFVSMSSKTVNRIVIENMKWKYFIVLCLQQMDTYSICVYRYRNNKLLELLFNTRIEVIINKKKLT